jgi:hypothetical protein
VFNAQDAEDAEDEGEIAEASVGRGSTVPAYGPSTDLSPAVTCPAFISLCLLRELCGEFSGAPL